MAGVQHGPGAGHGTPRTTKAVTERVRWAGLRPRERTGVAGRPYQTRFQISAARAVPVRWPRVLRLLPRGSRELQAVAGFWRRGRATPSPPHDGATRAVRRYGCSGGMCAGLAWLIVRRPARWRRAISHPAAGAAAAAVVGTVHMACGPMWGLTLIWFYLSSSKVGPCPGWGCCSLVCLLLVLLRCPVRRPLRAMP